MKTLLNSCKCMSQEYSIIHYHFVFYLRVRKTKKPKKKSHSVKGISKIRLILFDFNKQNTKSQLINFQSKQTSSTEIWNDTFHEIFHGH